VRPKRKGERESRGQFVLGLFYLPPDGAWGGGGRRGKEKEGGVSGGRSYLGLHTGESKGHGRGERRSSPNIIARVGNRRKKKGRLPHLHVITARKRKSRGKGGERGGRPLSTRCYDPVGRV